MVLYQNCNKLVSKIAKNEIKNGAKNALDKCDQMLE